MLAIARKRHPALTRALQVLTWTGQGWWWAFLVVLLASGIRFDFLRFPHREYVLTSMIAPGIAWVFVQALKLRYRRRRPFQVLPGFEKLTPAPVDESFPSGHTASVFAFFVAMLPLGPVVSAALAAWASVVAFSRYYLGVHFPSDIFVGALIGILAGASTGAVRPALGADRPDKYGSYVELAKHAKEGNDFRVEARDRGAKVLVLAIHGGIEPGSAELAEAIAGENANLYTFRALESYAGDFFDLHVTAANFDDPRALALAKASDVCVSIHGYRDAKTETVCLGGGNRRVRARVENALHATFPELVLREECKSIEGVNRKNIVNRCREKGVQLELSKKLRDRLANSAADFSKFAAATRSAVLSGRPKD